MMSCICRYIAPRFADWRSIGAEALVVGQVTPADGGRLKAIEFPRIAGHKAFDVTQGWYTDMLADIGQG